jgi:site-specific recombinase XerD
MRGVYEKVPGSGVWWIRYTDTQGNKRREKAGRKGDAKTLLTKRQSEQLQQKKLPEQYRAKVTFNELCDDAVEHSEATNTGKVTIDLKVKVAKLRPAFGESLATSISKQDIVRWLTETAEQKRWANSTTNRYQAALSLIFRVGIDNEKIERNPASLVKGKRENNKRIRFLSDEEEAYLYRAVLKRCPENLPALELSLQTGMRMTEQFSLRWDQVNLDRRTISLYQTKNGKPRHIGLNRLAVSALVSLRNDSAHVFPSTRKEKTSILSPKGWFNAALKEARIEDYSWHCNRHTFASRLVMAGVDLRTVGELLGHSSMQMTLRYAHLSPAHQAAAVDLLVRSGVDTQSDTGTLQGC